MKLHKAVSFFLFLIICGCPSSKKQEQDTKKEVIVEKEEISKRKETAWYEKGVNSCPEGAKIMGAGPPTGRHVWCARSDESYDGRRMVWHENGKVAEDSLYEKGKLVSKKMWYKNGNRMLEEMCSDKKTETTKWYQNGQKSKYEFVDDSINKWTEWYENGQKKAEGEESESRLTWTNWEIDGKRCEAIYKGKTKGTIKCWDSKGQLYKTEKYIGDKLVKTINHMK